MSETPCPFCGQIHGTACNQSDATTPAVVQDAQQYDWREDWNRVQTRIGYDEDAHVDAMHRLAAYIERLEAFVEVEDMSGAGVRVGEWIDRGNGYWALRISSVTAHQEPRSPRPGLLVVTPPASSGAVRSRPQRRR